MSQDARADEEQATARRARLLSLSYLDTSKVVNKQLYKQTLTLAELYQLRVIPLQVAKGYILFGITNTTSQQTLKMLRQRFSDSRVDMTLISDVGYREYMHLYDPPKQVIYQDIDIKVGINVNLVKSVSETLTKVRSDDVLAYLVKQAYLLKASDIHLENQAKDVRVR